MSEKRFLITESDERLNVKPVLRTRFRWRAARRTALMNAQIAFPSYRMGVVREGGRWCVVAFQNYPASPDFRKESE